MHRFLSGFAVAGVLAMGSALPALAHPVAVPTDVHAVTVQKVDWDNGCGPRCQADRREAHRRAEMRERELERRHMAEHRRWEERHERDEHRQVIMVPERR